MDLRNHRRMASELLKCGSNRVWVDPNRMDEVAEAVTREDMKLLIDDGVIRKRPVRSNSRGSARARALARSKGRGSGPGSRKGAKGGREKRKKSWMKKVRAQRTRLRDYRDSGRLDRGTYRKLYAMASGGAFRDLAHLDLFISSHRLWRVNEEV
jgi:large subunit ribosomal protein L19e